MSVPRASWDTTDIRQFTAKSLNRQALKAGKEEQAEKTKLEKVRRINTSSKLQFSDSMQAMKQGHSDIARIYAQNAVRKQNEKLNLLQLSSRVDAVAGRVQTAVTMRQITGNMMKVNRSLDVAMKSMSPERVRLTRQRIAARAIHALTCR